VKPFEVLKISTLGGLLLIIFSLPMLTATQLVGVLGTNSSRNTVLETPLSDESTFTINSGNNFNVSFDGRRIHPFASVTNPSGIVKTLTVQISELNKLPRGTKLDFGGDSIADLNNSQYNFSVQLNLNPHQTAPLSIDSNKADSNHGTMLLSLIED
jgi:hypothetical protein